MARSSGVGSGVAAILLAAGGGSRFGGGKLLAEFRGKPVISYSLDTIEKSPVDGAFVVVGGESAEIRVLCEPYGFEVVENPKWESGQSTSVLAGLEAAETAGEDFGAAVVMLADQPLVSAEAVGRLVESFERGARVAVAEYGGEPRNPVLFSREVWPELRSELRGDEGARSFLRRRPEMVEALACDGVGDPSDVDTVEDLRCLEKNVRSQGSHRAKEEGEL